MNVQMFFRHVVFTFALALSAVAAPVIDPLGNVAIPAGKSLIIPVTATSPNGRPLTFTATSSTNRIVVEVHTNNPFWKMTVVQVAPADAPGAFQTPYRGGSVTVTNVGDMTFMLFRDVAPHSVDVVQGLTMGGLYSSNTIFHRVATNFLIIQGGDPGTNGAGGPVFRYDDEFNPNALFGGKGQLAMANSGKDTDGSQFFITVGPTRGFDFRYTIFGQLVRGFNTLTNVFNTGTDTNARPLADVIITRASLVPNNFDTVLTLIGTNRTGIVGTIKVIADDGAGVRVTNTFTATTVTDTNSNDQPFLYPNTITNLVAPVNVTLTNYVKAIALSGVQLFWFPQFADQASYNAASNSSYNIITNTFKTLPYNVTNRDGQVQFFLKPSSNYVGTCRIYFTISNNSLWSSFPTFFPYDQQVITFVFGDTPIVARATNFNVQAFTPFTDQLLATFTNGLPNSDVTNFTAFINWGDNSTNSGVIVTNVFNQKEVRGDHTYTNAGNYPVYLTIQNYIGASATVVSTASVSPSLGLTVAGTNSIVAWPAWATDYQLQSTTNLAGANWQVVSNISTLNGYDSVVTNSPTNGIFFYRLKK